MIQPWCYVLCVGMRQHVRHIIYCCFVNQHQHIGYKNNILIKRLRKLCHIGLFRFGACSVLFAKNRLFLSVVV